MHTIERERERDGNSCNTFRAIWVWVHWKGRVCMIFLGYFCCMYVYVVGFCASCAHASSLEVFTNQNKAGVSLWLLPHIVRDLRLSHGSYGSYVFIVVPCCLTDRRLSHGSFVVPCSLPLLLFQVRFENPADALEASASAPEKGLRGHLAWEASTPIPTTSQKQLSGIDRTHLQKVCRQTSLYSTCKWKTTCL